MTGVATATRWLLGLLAAAVLVQAALAGLFLSGAAGARLPHLILGSMLPYLAVGAAIVGGIAWSQRVLSRGVGLGTVTMPVLLWAQMALGHMPFDATTAVHVTLGTALFALLVVLALAVDRHGHRASDPASPSGSS